MQRRTLKRKRGLEEELNSEKKMVKLHESSNEQKINKASSPDKQHSRVCGKLKDSVTQTKRQQVLPGQGTYPVIPKHNIDQLFSVLRKEKSLSVYEKKINQCLAHLHTSAKLHWNSPSVILKAMKDCIIRRKWKNLTQLLLMFIHLPCVKYRPIIRHMCQVLDKYHPVIHQKGLHDQFNMISLAHKGMKPGTTKLIE